jgi:predicted alpha/beta superfamily hydrolase
MGLLQKIILLFFTFSLCLSMVASDKGNDISIGRKYTIHSKILGEECTYYISLPLKYERKDNAVKKYPVIYLLDGKANFNSVSGITNWMSSYGNQIPDVILVAILNKNRYKDLTPTHSTVNLLGNPDMTLSETGRGDEFLKYIKEELMPEINKNYRTMAYNIFIGHSLGGLLVLYEFITNPKTFQAFIAIDPSLWWDNAFMLKLARKVLSYENNLKNCVYISIASKKSLFTTDKEQGLSIKPIQEFEKFLESNSSPNLRSKLQCFENEIHSSVPPASIYNGLLFIFEGYRACDAEIPKKLIEAPENLSAYYRRFSEKLGTTFLPPDGAITAIGYYYLLRVRNVDKAIGFFKLAVSDYPYSSMAYFNLAEAYKAKGNMDLATDNYKKALKLNPDNKAAKLKLDKLSIEK